MAMPPDVDQPASPAAAEVLRLKGVGNEELKAGKLKEAVASYSAALDLDPSREHGESAVILANRALAHLKLGEHGECKTDCSASLALQPRYGKALYRRAQAHEAAGALADAFGDVRELMRLEPSNREASAFAGRLKRAIEARASSSDLSTPSQAVEALRTAAPGSDDAVRAVGKLSRIAEDGGRSAELLHSGAVAALVAQLPEVGAVGSARELPMPLLGLVVEALDRIAGGDDGAAALRLVGSSGDALKRVQAVGAAAAGAREAFGAEAAAAAAADAASDAEVGTRIKNLVATARRSLSLVAHAAGSRGAAGSQDGQGELVGWLLTFLRHADDEVACASRDALVRVCNADTDAVKCVLPKVFRALLPILGDEESEGHRVAIAVLSKLMAPDPSLESDAKDAHLKSITSVCEAVLSPTLRSDDAPWDEHVSAIHGVTAVLEVNKEAGAWLLRQESIFWSLAEAAELDDDDLQKSCAEVYAHAANDPAQFREKAGTEPIKQLKAMLKSPKPRVRCRACVALAKVCLLHQDHRVDIHPTGRLLTATLGLLEAKASPSVHRWAVEALMFLTILPDTKAHLAERGQGFGSLVSLADSVSADASLHFSLVSAFRRLCVPREKSDEQKRLENEMEPEQIEKMRQLQAGGTPGGAAPAEKEDDPAVLTKLAAQLAADDACLVLAELVAHAKTEAIQQPAAEVLLAMAATPDVRGKMVQQGGFKALLALTLSKEKRTREAAAWGLAKVGISINPALYPRRTGSGPEGMVAPLIQLVDEGESELMTFEGCLALTNLATVPELRDRIVSAQGWRAFEMAMTSDNSLVQRAGLEAMSNLVTNEQIAEKFLKPDSTACKIFVGFCGSDDPQCQIAASGGIATLAAYPEIAVSLVAANALEPLVEICLVSTNPPILHRAAVGLQRLFAAATDAVLGPKGGPAPDHSVLALGALSYVSGRADAPTQAVDAAREAMADIAESRPDVALPPPELVAEAVRRLEAEAAAREKEREEEEAAAAVAQAEAEAQAASQPDGDDDDGTVL